MQYLLTEEEYTDLHGEGDDEAQRDKIELMKLHTDVATFIEMIKAIDIVQRPQDFHEKSVRMEILYDKIPESFMDILFDKYELIRILKQS